MTIIARIYLRGNDAEVHSSARVLNALNGLGVGYNEVVVDHESDVGIVIEGTQVPYNDMWQKGKEGRVLDSKIVQMLSVADIAIRRGHIPSRA